MKNTLQVVILIIIIIIITVVIDRVFFMKTAGLEEVKKQVQGQIDSLNAEIGAREDSISAINNRIAEYEEQLTTLHTQILAKDRQINYYKRKGRFEYEFSNDSLYRELNAIIKQRLSEVSSAGDSLP